MCLAIKANDFNFIFITNKPKIELVGRQWTQKSTLFGGFEGSFLTILGVKKVIFWTFSKLFGSCLGSV